MSRTNECGSDSALNKHEHNKNWPQFIERPVQAPDIGELVCLRQVILSFRYCTMNGLFDHLVQYADSDFTAFRDTSLLLPPQW